MNPNHVIAGAFCLGAATAGYASPCTDYCSLERGWNYSYCDNIVVGDKSGCDDNLSTSLTNCDVAFSNSYDNCNEAFAYSWTSCIANHEHCLEHAANQTEIDTCNTNLSDCEDGALTARDDCYESAEDTLTECYFSADASHDDCVEEAESNGDACRDAADDWYDDCVAACC